MANPPIFARSLLANIEIFAVIGIFTLYALEFAGVHTFSEFFSDDTAQLTVLSFQAGRDFVEVPQIVVLLFFPTLALFTVYFAFVRKRLFRKK